MSNDITTKLTFVVDQKQLKQATEQLSRLQRRLKGMKQAGDSSSTSVNKVQDNISRLTIKVKQLNGTFTPIVKVIKKGKVATDSLTKAIKKNIQVTSKSIKVKKQLQTAEKRLGDSAKKAVKNVKQNTSAMGGAGKAAKKTGSSLGFTGLAFGFIGGAAAFAGNQIKQFFINVIRDGVEDIGAMNRAIVQSGIDIEGFLAGSSDEYVIVGDRIKALQQVFSEFNRAEIAQAFEQIGRAVSEDVPLEDIEKITNALLTIARIDKTGGAGLAKTAVDLKRSMTQFGIGADELDNFLDKLVNTNQQGAIELNQLVSSLGFAGAQAQRFGVNLNDTLALTGFIFEKSGRKAGAAGRTFGNILQKLGSVGVATNEVLLDMGIRILDTAGNFNEFLDIIDDARVAFQKLKAEGKGQIFESALLEEFGFDKTAARGFLSLVNTPREELEKLSRGVGKVGTADLLSQAIGKGADVQIKAFENEIRNLKAEFATGLAPALVDFTNVIRTFSQDQGFVSTIQAFGHALGSNLAVALNLVVGIMKPFADLLKNNAAIADIAAKALIGLVGALTAMGVIFPLLGGFFAMIFLHEKLIQRFDQLGVRATLLTKAYGRLTLRVIALNNSMKTFIASVRAGTFSTAAFATTLKTKLFAALTAFKIKLIAIGTTLKGYVLWMGRAAVSSFHFSKAAITSVILSLSTLNIRFKSVIISLKIFILNTKLAMLGLGLFGKIAVLGSIAGLTKLGLSLKTGALAFRIFAVSAVTSLFAVAAAWVIAFAPILIAIGVFILAIGLMRVFQDEIVGIANSLDSTGNAGRNFKDNMNGLFDFLKTGDLEPFWDAINADIRDTQTRFGAFGAAWDQLISDLQRSDLGIWIREMIGNIQTFFESLTFEIPPVWDLLIALGVTLGGLFPFLAFKFNEFLAVMGVDVPQFYADLDEMLTKLKEAFAFILEPIDAFKKSLEFEIPKVFQQLEEAIDNLKSAWKSFVDSIAENPIIKGIMQLLGIGGQFITNVDLGKDAVGRRGEKIIPKAESFFPGPENERGPGADISSRIVPIGAENININDLVFPGPDILEEAYRQQHEVLTDTTVNLIEQGEAILQNTEVLTAINEELATTNESTAKKVELEKESNVLSSTSNTLSTQSNVNIGIANNLTTIDNTLVDLHSGLLTKFNTHLGFAIIEYIRNTNEMSVLTTMVARVQLMFANLVAQGNRAAGKLASLRVSASGRFSISDPGISASDQKFISNAEANLASTKANQIKLEFDIDINPTINLTNGNSAELSEVADDLSLELSEALQKRIATIS